MRLKTAWALAIARVMKRNNLGRIESAGAEGKTLRVSYIKKNGQHISREVAPYETKPHRSTGNLMVYVTDNEGGPGQIKSYIANRIQRAGKPLEEFTPEWPVQYGDLDDSNEA